MSSHTVLVIKYWAYRKGHFSLDLFSDVIVRLTHRANERQQRVSNALVAPLSRKSKQVIRKWVARLVGQNIASNFIWRICFNYLIKIDFSVNSTTMITNRFFVFARNVGKKENSIFLLIVAWALNRNLKSPWSDENIEFLRAWSSFASRWVVVSRGWSYRNYLFCNFGKYSL